MHAIQGLHIVAIIFGNPIPAHRTPWAIAYVEFRLLAAGAGNKFATLAA